MTALAPHAKWPVNPAFVVAMVSKGPSRREPATSKRNGPPRNSTRKRVRASTLSRKYRHNVEDVDEALLVGDHTQSPASESSMRLESSSHSASSAPVSASVKTPSSPASHTRQSSYQSAVRFSRFPGSWPETVSQVSAAVSCAVLDGHDRIRVDVKTPELIADAHLADSIFPDEVSRHSRRIALLVESTNEVLKQLFRLERTEHNPHLLFAPTRASLFFNNAADAVIGRRHIEAKHKHLVDVYVLGESPRNRDNNVNVIIAPSNRLGNPAHIEAVEMVHYSSWTEQKLVIILNPDLFALTRFTSFGDEPRQPCFLRDYVSTYYLDPAAFPSKTATGAVLRCFPRKWEMYLLKVHNDMGFRLIAEQRTPPSPERIRYEFSWRVQRELDDLPAAD